ncbi:MAG: TonB-dependent receptor plug domain-containing protein, partial [Bacteroidota bacterium]
MNKPKAIQHALFVFMKITLTQALIMAVLTSIVYAADLKGQEILDKKVSLIAENREIKSILTDIEKKAQVRFTYRSRLIQASRKVSIHTTETKLSEILSLILGPGIIYEAIGKQIILRPEENIAPEPDYDVVKEPIADITVRGHVSDETGVAVPGVNVLEKGTTNGTTTDANGDFSLNVADENSVLVFSFIGFITQEVQVANTTNFNISLKSDLVSLTEVVVVGYGEQKKATITGSVTSVKSDVITQAPVTNLTNALAGRLPGVIFVNRSGEPGYDGSQIRIRGTNTIGNPSALVVIDGIANRNGGLERLNPQDIESITVLKDASAAIYGAQAANGVILVTTKRGKAGKPEINFNYNIGFNRPT